jgi:hypothetical protein
MYRGHLNSDSEISVTFMIRVMLQVIPDFLTVIFDLSTDDGPFVIGYTLPSNLANSRDIEYIKGEARKECARALELRLKGEETEVWSTRLKPKPVEIVEIDLISL